MKRIFYLITFSFCLLFFFGRCQNDKPAAEAVTTLAPEEPDSLAIREMYAASPVLSPEASMDKMYLDENFRVELVAAEPLVIAPVAMTFDESGRLWVAEMMNYMPDTAGTGEELPTGKIVILEDENRDGRYDKRIVFLDSLVLPRALCLVENGLLVAEPPNLWFYEINGHKPGKKTLVDNKYTSGANVEHEPNGLLRALDNWIYNAKSSTRYKKKGDKWLKEETHFRGQWGIAQDDYGRLYYNNNSQNLLGDYFSPGFRPTNSNQRRLAGFNENIVPDNRVYPVRATTGVNRGYMEGTLDEKLRLVNVTAACGPALNRGALFGKEYYLDAFIAEPAGNLIKRNQLQQQGYLVQGEQAYAGKEFLASEDERFRPVNLYSGPDGALYVLDMYRGIIQHKHFLTDYLAQEIMDRSLHQPLSCGRIYRIVPKDKKVKPVLLPQDPEKLVQLLQHPTGWVRDRSQQLLIDKKQVQAIPSLRQLLQQAQEPLARLHALWTLEGLGALQETDLLPLLQDPIWPVRMQALSTLPTVLTRKNYNKFVPALHHLLQQHDTLAAPAIAYLANTIRPINKASSDKLLETLLQQYPNNSFVADAIISNLQGREEAYYKKALTLHNDSSLVICQKLEQVVAAIAEAKTRRNQELVDQKYPIGAALYVTSCQSCHGADGGGMEALAPPLNKSEWVTGPKNRLIPIILHGLTGPILVNGKMYQAPEINGEMPAFGNNSELSNEDLAELTTYIRRSWNNNGTRISQKDVSTVREKYKGRQNAFTMEELLKLPEGKTDKNPLEGCFNQNNLVFVADCLLLIVKMKTQKGGLKRKYNLYTRVLYPDFLVNTFRITNLKHCYRAAVTITSTHTLNTIMQHIAIISSSVRTGRKTHRVALFFQKFINENKLATTEILDLKTYNFPVFEERLQYQKEPTEQMLDFANRIKQADGVIIATPEYNGGYPASLKNVLDLLYDEWYRKPIGLVTVSGGQFGGSQVMTSLVFTLWKIRAWVAPGKFQVVKVQDSYDEEGNPTDKATTEKIAKGFMQELLWCMEAKAKMDATPEQPAS